MGFFKNCLYQCKSSGNAIDLGHFPSNPIPKNHADSSSSRVSGTRNGETMILSKCAICGSKKSKLIKKQEAKGLVSNLGIRTPLSKIPLLGDVFCFECNSIES